MLNGSKITFMTYWSFVNISPIEMMFTLSLISISIRRFTETKREKLDNAADVEIRKYCSMDAQERILGAS
jgi:hypothetical protein